MSLLLYYSLWIEISLVAGYTVMTAPNRVTCWTCPNKGSNTECNDWAPDRFCPVDENVCQTVHSFNQTTGESVSVDKRCVSSGECTGKTVGCTRNQSTQLITCVSCCSTSLCNQEVAHDNQTAIRMSVTVIGSSACNLLFDWTVISLVYFVPFLIRRITAPLFYLEPN